MMSAGFVVGLPTRQVTVHEMVPDAKTLAPAAATPSRPLMRQQEATALSGANSAAIGFGCAKEPRMPGVTFVTGPWA